MANIITKKLLNKLIALFLLVSLIPIFIIGYLSYESGKKSLETQYLESLKTIVNSREKAINLYLEMELESVRTFSLDFIVRKTLIDMQTKKADVLFNKMTHFLKHENCSWQSKNQ